MSKNILFNEKQSIQGTMRIRTKRIGGNEVLIACIAPLPFSFLFGFIVISSEVFIAFAASQVADISVAPVPLRHSSDS